MTATTSRVLVLGNADVGKTTFLVQLHGRIKAGRGRLRSRGAPTSLTPIEEGLKRLQQGVAVKHTAQGTDVTLELPAVTNSAAAVDIVVPDYAGEDLRRVLLNRRLPERWRSEAAVADRWLLLVRLSKHPELPDVLSRPIGELARAPIENPAGDADALPADMWAVELLQALLYWREQGPGPRHLRPRLSLVLSCWDELDTTAPPVHIARHRLALLDSYCRANWPADRFDVVGLSSQGHPLDEDEPAEDYLNQGPQQMGWVVGPSGGADSDLTLLVTDEA